MERNITLDYFKIFLSILVVTIHLQPLLYNDVLYSWIVSNGIARIAVPSFFLINGYYLSNKLFDGKAVFKYVKRLLILYAVWIVIYSYGMLNYDLKMTILMIAGGYKHLWYVAALIVGTVLLFGLNKIIKNKHVLLALCIALYLIGAFIQMKMNITSVVDLYKTRNALFVGLPFLFIGSYIKQMWQTFKQFSSIFYLLFLFLATIVLLLETGYCFFNTSGRDMYFSLILVCPLLLIVILKYSKFKEEDGYTGLLASGIYFVHILAMDIAALVYPSADLKIYVLPLVLFLSLLITAVIIQLNKRIKIFL